MADAERTIDIIFGAVNNTGDTFRSLGRELNYFEGQVSSVTGPIAGLTTDLLLAETAVITLAAAYGGYALSESIKFENAQIDLQKVLSETDPQIESYTQTVTDLSEQYGISAVSILAGIANFTQAGFAAEESALLQRNALDLVIAGDVAATEASEILIASIKGFGVEAEASTRFIEALNNVSNNYATDLGELASGMAAISPVASAMGFSFEETTGLITPIIEVFRSGDEAANALKTGLLQLTSDSAPVGEALASIGVAQFDLNGKMRSGKDIFYDVAEAFVDLDDNQQLYITSQLVGINQSARMVTVFNNLALSQEVTSTALERTGSVVDEVNLKLGSTEGQVNRAIVVFNNLARSIGDELRPAFSDSVEGVDTLLQSFRDIVTSGGLDPLFDALDVQGEEFRAFLIGIAQALPEAFAGLDFSDLLNSFDTLKNSISGLFDGVDLTTPEGLRDTLQGLVDFITLLTNASAGAIQGLTPLFDGIVRFLEVLGNSESDTQTFIGQIGGMVTSVDALLPLLGFLADAMILVGGSITLLGTERAVIGLGSIATSLTSISPTNVALAAAIGAVSFAINRNIDAYNALQQAEQDILDTQANTIDSHNAVALKLHEISQATGITVGSIDDLDRAIASGNITFNEATGVYESTATAIRDFDAEVEQVAIDSVNATDVTDEYTESMRQLGFSVDPVTGKISTLSEVAEESAIAQDNATDSASGYKVELINGIPTYTQVARAHMEVSTAVEQSAQAMDTLSERERLAIEQTHELEITLEELASNERISAMEFTADIEVARIEGQAAQMIAAFDAIGVSVTSTNELIGELYGSTTLDWDSFGFTQRALLDDANDRAEELTRSQVAMNEAQVRYLDAMALSLVEGTEVTITADGLEPSIEAFMFEILRKIQLRVTGDRNAFLLGVG